MTGPHLTPEREADLRADLADARAAAWEELAIPTSDLAALLAALDAEREAHQQTRTALEASTAYLTKAVSHLVDPKLWPEWRINADAQVQENQRVLGLTVAEADKPHDGNER